MDDLIQSKVEALVVMLVLALTSGLLPIKVRSLLMNSSSLSDKRIKIILSACLCFGAGVLMATVFLHILSETRESFLTMMDEGIIKDTEYPFTELVLCLGFFLIYFVEEIVHSCVHYNQHKRHEDYLEEDFSLHRNSISVKSFKKSHDSFRIKKDLAASENKDANQMENNNCNNRIEVSCTCENTNQIYINKDDSFVSEKENLPSMDQLSRPSISWEQKDLNEVSLTRSILVILALSLHGAFEGLSLGVENDKSDVWLLCVALSAHKVFIAFSIGMELLEVGVKLHIYVIHIIIFSIASPIGGIIGTTLKETIGADNAAGRIVIAVLQGVSGGTILYVTFCEVLERERTKPSGRFTRLFALASGFAVMAGLQAISEHNHGEEANTNINSTLVDAQLHSGHFH